MLLTNKKILVTKSMLDENNMIRGIQFGIPIDPLKPSLGLQWKDIFELGDDDFDKLEEYFLSKKPS